MVWHIDWAWFDTSGGRMRWLYVIDTGSGIAAEQLMPRLTEAAHRAATLRRRGRLDRSDGQLVHGTSRLEPRRRRTLRLRASPRQPLTWDRRLLEFVPDSFRKPARNQRNLRASDFVLRGDVSAEILLSF